MGQQGGEPGRELQRLAETPVHLLDTLRTFSEIIKVRVHSKVTSIVGTLLVSSKEDVVGAGKHHRTVQALALR